MATTDNNDIVSDIVIRDPRLTIKRHAAERPHLQPHLNQITTQFTNLIKQTLETDSNNIEQLQRIQRSFDALMHTYTNLIEQDDAGEVQQPTRPNPFGYSSVTLSPSQGYDTEQFVTQGESQDPDEDMDVEASS